MKVLVADDDLVTRRLLTSSLQRWGYDVVIASDGEEAYQHLQQPDPPRLLILDWQMPGMDGVQLCRKLRQEADESYTYMILLTGNHAQEQVIQGLEAGADDYITKPFEPQELRVRLRNGKRILHLLQQLTAAREALRELASRDPLTGLWNHNSIISLLSHELQRAKRQGAAVALALVDLDHFKNVNDTYGHLVGDEVLSQVAECLNRCVRAYDAVGRYGGEEFLIVMPGCDQVNAVSHGERLRLALSHIEVDTPQGPVKVTGSFGVAVVDTRQDVDVYEAIRSADTALYSAKRAGRNQVHCADFVPAAATG